VYEKLRELIVRGDLRLLKRSAGGWEVAALDMEEIMRAA
jgi:hypothetical protein